MRPLRLVPLAMAGLSAVVLYVAVVLARWPEAATGVVHDATDAP